MPSASTTFRNSPVAISHSAVQKRAAEQPRRRVFDLRQQFLGPHDRPGDQLGKERDEELKIPKRVNSLALANDVDRVADGLEDVERDAQRQDPVRHAHHVVDPQPRATALTFSHSQLRYLKIASSSTLAASTQPPRHLRFGGPATIHLAPQ